MPDAPSAGHPPSAGRLHSERDTERTARHVHHLAHAMDKIIIVTLWSQLLIVVMLLLFRVNFTVTAIISVIF